MIQGEVFFQSCQTGQMKLCKIQRKTIWPLHRAMEAYSEERDECCRINFYTPECMDF